jgi:uncharacterized protein|tara:strand:+ start:620 stop:1330 length:711 start_codon:yes stop_codon:yes gene_type:complete
MHIKLNKKPKNPIIIEGFPGFGLVGTIASEFLIDHLKTEQIGKIIFEDMPALVAIHESKVVEPLGIFYSKEYNIVILHAVTASTGFEWEIANNLVKIAEQLGAKEIISLEGVGSGEKVEETKTFHYASLESRRKVFKNIGVEPLKEGIIMGVTGALLLKSEKVPVSCIFAETHSQLPDSKAAAKIIEALDKYLGLKVDSKPLLKQAEKFEDKLKGIIQQGHKVQELSEQKKMSYVG